MGAMMRLRSSRLIAASPVARSDQPSIVHSISERKIRARPSTNTMGCSTRPTAAAPTPKAATTGQKLAATGWSVSTSATFWRRAWAEASASRNDTSTRLTVRETAASPTSTP